MEDLLLHIATVGPRVSGQALSGTPLIGAVGWEFVFPPENGPCVSGHSARDFFLLSSIPFVLDNLVFLYNGR